MIVKALKRIVAALFAFVFASLARGAEASAAGNDPMDGVVDGVAAFVNDEAVTIRDVMVGVPAQLKAMAEQPGFWDKTRSEAFAAAYQASLDMAIERCLVLQAYQAGTERISEKALAQFLHETIESRYDGSVAKLQEDLAKSRMTYDDWKRIMEENIVVRSMRQSFVTGNVHVSPNAIAAEYEARKEDLKKPATVNVFVFALPDDDDFAAGHAAFTNRLASGEAFETLARELSVDVMADVGGDYGFIVPEVVLAPALAEAVNKLKDGEVSEPVPLGSRRYVLFRKASTPEKDATLRDVREQIEAELHAQEADRLYTRWIARLREAAVIRTFDLK
ncbi:MAG: peptidylprolyl isomerase [Kiritimatiellia bacterium]|jgi:parvulin-like peptidyl-prolyl isomerase